MPVSEALLNCISAALDGRECALTLAPDDWTALLRLAGEQKLLPLVYAAVRGTPGFAAAPEAVRAAARAATAWSRSPACRAWIRRPASCSADRIVQIDGENVSKV